MPQVPAWLSATFTRILLPAISAAGGFGVVFLLARHYLLEKIRASVQHEYDVKLESYRDELKRESDVGLEKIRRFNTEQIAAQQVAFQAFQSSHGAAFERRLKAIEVIWEAFIYVSNNGPPVLTWVDVHLESEYSKLLSSRTGNLIQQLSDGDVMKLVDGTKGAELARPFAKDQLYAILFVYRAIVGRIIVLLMEGQKKGSVPFWPRDPVIKQHLQVLLSPQELQQFEKRPVVNIFGYGGYWRQNSLPPPK